MECILILATEYSLEVGNLISLAFFFVSDDFFKIEYATHPSVGLEDKGIAVEQIGCQFQGEADQEESCKCTTEWWR